MKSFPTQCCCRGTLGEPAEPLVSGDVSAEGPSDRTRGNGLRGGLDWTLGERSSPGRWPGIGAGCPRQC